MNGSTPATLLPDDLVDLHLHTLASDGRWTPANLAAYLGQQGFRVAAVADHDTMDSVPAFTEECARFGITVVPAVEMTTRWGDRQLHCLIYGVDLNNPDASNFAALLRRQQTNLVDMSTRIVDLLERHGRKVPSLDEVLAGRPLKPYMVYRAMIRDGHGSDLRTAHNIVKALGEPGLVDVSLAETVAAAHAAGALAVIAHPGRDDGWGVLKEIELDRLLADIPIDGVEAHYRSYKDDDTQRYRDWAARHGLVVSAGSDSHWEGFPVNPIPYPARWTAELLDRLGFEISSWEGHAWVPQEPAAVTASAG
jgi:hypothetical protein